MTRRKTSYLQGSGSPGSYLLPAEDHRLNRAALWTPSTGNGLRVRGGMAPGNGAGTVTATAGGVNIAAGTCAVPGSVTGVQGVYECTWDAAEFRAAPAASASTYRQILVVCHVYDSLNGDTRDDWDLEVVLGAGASTLGTAAVPATPTNAVVLATGSVDPAGNVSVVPTGAFQVARGGVLPVSAADAGLPAYDGQIRWHPTYGVQAGRSGAWADPTVPMNGLYTNVQNGVPTAQQYGVGTLTKTRENGGLNATISQDSLTLPAGLWLINWELIAVGPAINGRNYAEVRPGNATTDNTQRHRQPVGTTGDDFGGITTLIELPATTRLELVYFLTMTAGTFTLNNYVHVARIGAMS